MRRTARALAVAAGILLLATALTSGQPRTRVARHVATVTWGPVCDDQVAIVKRPLGYRPDGRPVIGRAEWDNAPDGRRIDCVVQLAAGYRWAWWQLCALLVHEYGHLAGRHHVRNPWSVMYPVIWRPFWRCGPDHRHPRLRP